jgi:hypothetical protein
MLLELLGFLPLRGKNPQPRKITLVKKLGIMALNRKQAFPKDCS